VVDIDPTAIPDTDRRERALTHDTHPLARPCVAVAARHTAFVGRPCVAVAARHAVLVGRRPSGRDTRRHRRAGRETS
jgi:hypothetical protein